MPATFVRIVYTEAVYLSCRVFENIVHLKFVTVSLRKQASHARYYNRQFNIDEYVGQNPFVTAGTYSVP